MSTERPLPRFIEFRRSALDQAIHEGSLAQQALPRLSAAVLRPSEDPVAVRVECVEDAQRRVVLKGRMRATLILSCQRCLEPAEVSIEAVIGGMVVTSDEAAADVPRDFEPIMAGDDRLDLHALIDDELLLALPMTVQCDRPECRAAFDKPDPAGDSGPSRGSNPFAALASLKDNDEPH